MSIGTTVTWREAITKQQKNGRKAEVTSRVLVGTITAIHKGSPRRKKIEIVIIAVLGQGQDLVGKHVFRTRGQIASGEAWLLQTQGGNPPPK